MGISIKWDITYRCNLFCTHCIKGDQLSNTAKEPSLEEVKQIIDNLSEKKIDYIHLLGGEPTVRDDFIEILNYFDEKGIPFGLNTNGLLMGTDRMLNAVTSPKNFKNIIFSIEAPIAEVNDEMRGKAVFDKTISNLKKLIAYKKEKNYDHFYVTINTVISKTNMDYILPMINYCVELGVDELVLLQLIPEGNALDANITLSFDDELHLVNEIASVYSTVKDKLRIIPRFVRPLAVDYANEVLEQDFPDIEHGCNAGTEFACITNLGELYSCDRYMEATLKKNTPQDLSLIHKTFDEIWRKNEFTDIFSAINQESFYQNTDPCNSCKHLKVSCWPCPVELMNNIDDVYMMKSCIQYNKIIQEHHLKNDCEIIVTDKIIREVASDEEDYILFNTETFETISLNQEAYLIWNELRLMEQIQYNKAISSISDKYSFAFSYVKETIDSLINLNYLREKAT